MAENTTDSDLTAELDALVSLVLTDPEQALQSVWAVDEQTVRMYLTLALPALAKYAR